MRDEKRILNVPGTEQKIKQRRYNMDFGMPKCVTEKDDDDDES